MTEHNDGRPRGPETLAELLRFTAQALRVKTEKLATLRALWSALAEDETRTRREAAAQAVALELISREVRAEAERAAEVAAQLRDPGKNSTARELSVLAGSLKVVSNGLRKLAGPWSI